ncbi:MAG: thioredoxin [Thioalkalivibrionaceae bacterium]
MNPGNVAHEASFEIDVNAQSFASAVIEASRKRLVVVDFWAAWCGPCRQLMPMLHALANEYAGAFRLAKVDTDAEQALATQFGVRSLPTVMFFRHGEVVDQFMGVQPESAIRAKIDAHIERPSDAPRAEGRTALKEERHQDAIAAFQRALELDPNRDEIRVELAEALLAAGQVEAALEQLAPLPIALTEQEHVKRLRTRARFAAQSGAETDLTALASEAENPAASAEALERLATALMAQDRAAEALPIYLRLMRDHRQHKNDDGQNVGHQGLLSAFEILGARHPAVAEFRKKMVALLY